MIKLKKEDYEKNQKKYEKYINEIKEIEEKSKKLLNDEYDLGYIYFTTGDTVKKYIENDKVNVYVYLENEKVVSFLYIKNIFLSKDFTYDDLGKFFRCNEQYKNYIKNIIYKNKENEFKNNLQKIYEKNIENFDFVLKEIFNENRFEKFRNEMNENFDEVNEKRKEIIKKMNEKTEEKNLIKLNREFFYFDSKDLEKNFIEIKEKNKELIKIYDEYLKKSLIKINETSENFDLKKYFECNVENFIEIDTYATHPNFRNKNLTKILVFNGIKNILIENFEEKKKEFLFFVLTVHNFNYLSKKICNFFEINDFINVLRKKGNFRNVYIKKINKKEYKNYLNKIEKKLIFFGIEKNNNIKISEEEKKCFINEKKIFEEKLKIEIENEKKKCENEKTKKFFENFKLNFIN